MYAIRSYYVIIDAARIRFWRLIVPALTMIIGGPLATYLLFPAFVESYLLRLWYTVTELHATPQTLLAGRLESWETMLAFAGEIQGLLVGALADRDALQADSYNFV